MKVMFASDIHGSACCCQKLLEAFDASGAGRLVLLGDILYHGPRNDLPAGYDPKEVIRMLNGCRDKIYGVRGNCDTEVDQMVWSLGEKYFMPPMDICFTRIICLPCRREIFWCTAIPIC